jgi:polyisoprenoid-binding protein YceI
MSEPVVFTVASGDSVVRIHATSNVHPIDGETTALEGEVGLFFTGGEPDLSRPLEAEVRLQVSDLGSGNIAYDTEMRRRLESRRFPGITGRLTTAEAIERKHRYLVRGDLTFHGVTRPVEADMTVTIEDGGPLRARWEQTIDIRDFDVKPPRILMFKVDPEVRIRIDLVATRGDNESR